MAHGPSRHRHFLYKLKIHGEQVAIWKAKLLLGLRRFGH